MKEVKDSQTTRSSPSVEKGNAHISNIDALNSATHTLRIQFEYTQKQCVGVAIEGIDIWYMVLSCEPNWAVIRFKGRGPCAVENT